MRRVATAFTLAAIVAAAAAGLHAAAPPAVDKPSPTAFDTAPEDLSEWAAAMEQGYTLRAAVSGIFLDASEEAIDTLVLIQSPQHAPTSAEAHALDSHLDAGGAVWVLDPDGIYNSWLALRGVVVSPHRLIDPGAGDSALVRLESASPADEPVLSRSPAALIVDDVDEWDALLLAPGYTYLDIDGNGTADRVDTPGPHAVGLATTYASGGTLTVVGDASHLANLFYKGTGRANADHATWAIRQALPSGGTVVVDESQQGWTAPERLPVAALQKVQQVNALPAWVAMLAVVAVVAAAVVLALRARVIHPYEQHTRSDAVTPPREQDPTATVEDAAWELLADRSKQPVDRLRRLGAAEAANGLADDPVLRRVLLGHAQGGDDAKILQAYLHSQNHRSNGARP